MKILFYIIDLIASPVTLLSAIWLKFNRRYISGFWAAKGPFSQRIFRIIGIFPIMDDFYEPYFYTGNDLSSSLRSVRDLPGIQWNIDDQLKLLKKFNYSNEIGSDPSVDIGFHFDNGSFMSGDAEICYNMIRHFKPRRIIEVGCGNSTLIIHEALLKNQKCDSSYSFNHICIEPYYNEHLSKLNVQFIKEKVEHVDFSLFLELKVNDILFIDSSHIVRPQGDVLFEILKILPSLNPGVLVHFHDIFSPRDYLDEWITNGVVFWNEQYFLEAFLSFNLNYDIICSLNYLKNDYFELLKEVTPNLTKSREPGSFWIQRNNNMWK